MIEAKTRMLFKQHVSCCLGADGSSEHAADPLLDHNRDHQEAQRGQGHRSESHAEDEPREGGGEEEEVMESEVLFLDYDSDEEEDDDQDLHGSGRKGMEEEGEREDGGSLKSIFKKGVEESGKRGGKGSGVSFSGPVGPLEEEDEDDGGGGLNGSAGPGELDDRKEVSGHGNEEKPKKKKRKIKAKSAAKLQVCHACWHERKLSIPLFELAPAIQRHAVYARTRPLGRVWVNGAARAGTRRASDAGTSLV